MSVPPPIDGEKLLEQAAWIRTLARSLVADAHLAEDLAQDTCVAAIERPPSDASNLRGWLATVLHNFHRQTVRARSRRNVREEQAARAESQPDTLDVLERATLQRELYEAVMSLSEPNRTAILLRFFDGLSQRKIASRLRVPVATVHSRLQRGLAELRKQLSRHRGGDTRAWVLALLPLAKQAGPWTPGAFGPPLGALLMDAKVKIGIGIALAACGVIGVWPLIRPSAEPAHEPVAANAALPKRVETHAPAETQVAPAEETTSRVAAPELAKSEPVPEPVAVPPPARVRGRVLDPRASPLSGVKIAFRGGEPTEYDRGGIELGNAATSDRYGTFEMDAPTAQGELIATDPNLATVMAGAWQPGATLEPVVVVAPLRPLAGSVIDESGAPLAGARITLDLAKGFESRFVHVLDASMPRVCRAESGERGEFALPRAFAVEGSRLVVSLEGFLPDTRPAPEVADSAIEIVLRRPPRDERALDGVVLGPSGEMIENARVSLGERSTSTDRTGRFSFELLDDAPAELLRAVKRGYLPAELSASPERASNGRRWPSFVTLKLGGPTSSISGRVVDEDGKPLERIRIWLSDPTYFGLIDDDPVQVENLLAGSLARRELESLITADSSGRERDLPSAFWTWVDSDADGRFKIEGLLGRAYRLKAMDSHTLALAEEGPFQAGSEDVRIVLPTRDTREVKGRVLTRAGEPVPGVRVQVARTVMSVSRVTPGGSSRTSRSMPGAKTVTNEEGRFVLAGVPPESVFVTFASDAILPDYRDLRKEDDVSALEVVVITRRHFQIELDEPVARADQIAVLDDKGEALSILMIRGENEYSGPNMPLTAGRSSVLVVSELATTLVLLHGEEEVERHSISLAANTLNTLRF